MSLRRTFLFVIVLAALAGCAAPPEAAPPAPAEESAPSSVVPPAPAPGAAKIVVGGTGIGTDALSIAGTAYAARNPGKEVVVLPPVGSGGGIKAVLQDQLDLSISARAPKESEPGLTFTPLYKEPVIFVAHVSAGVTELSLRDVERIFHGEVTNWRELGGNDLPIRLYSREPEDSITKKYMAAYPSLRNDTWTSSLNELHDDIAMYGILSNTPGAAGFTVRTPLVLRDAAVAFVTIDGIVPTAPAVASGDYPLTLTVGLVAPEDLGGPAREYHDWLSSPLGRSELRSAGYLTV